MQNTSNHSGSCWILVKHLIYYIDLQFDARVGANLTLAHESCPAGFEEVEGIIQGLYNCRCSTANLNIQSCNETTEDVLLKVRECMTC